MRLYRVHGRHSWQLELSESGVYSARHVHSLRSANSLRVKSRDTRPRHRHYHCPAHQSDSISLQLLTCILATCRAYKATRRRMGGADRATETLQTALINSGNSHNLVNLLLRNVVYEKLNLTVSLHQRANFQRFYLKNVRKIKKTVKRRKNKKRKKRFYACS